jgi:hypothetical protein
MSNAVGMGVHGRACALAELSPRSSRRIFCIEFSEEDLSFAGDASPITLVNLVVTVFVVVEHVCGRSVELCWNAGHTLVRTGDAVRGFVNW